MWRGLHGIYAIDTARGSELHKRSSHLELDVFEIDLVLVVVSPGEEYDLGLDFAVDEGFVNELVLNG
jgi:hypothetical protein